MESFTRELSSLPMTNSDHRGVKFSLFSIFRRRSLVLPLFISLCAFSAHASSFGGSFTSGKDYSGFRFNGGLHIDAAQTTQILCSYGEVNSTGAYPSKVNEFSAGLGFSPDEAWDFVANVTTWKDDLNFVSYFGPTLEATYAWTRDGGGRSPNEMAEKDSRNTTDRDPRELPPSDILSVSLTGEYFLYQTLTTAMDRQVTVRKGKRLTTETIKGDTGQETLNQEHLGLMVCKPLFGGRIAPYVSGSTFRYSRPPADIEALSGQPRFEGIANRFDATVGGFERRNWEIGMELNLPGAISASGGVGNSQSATDGSWSVVREIEAWHTFADHIRARIEWSDGAQYHSAYSLWTSELSYQF